MFFLEIAMIIVGLGAVIFSFRMTEKKVTVGESDSQDDGIDVSEINDKLQERIEEIEEKVEKSFQETDDRLSEISNEKIMGMSEYSDQVLDKIEKNHAEVVFLYDMLNEKQEEIKKLIADISSIKADLQNEAAIEYQKLKEQEKELDELRKDLQVEMLQYSSSQKEVSLTDSEDVPNKTIVDEFQELLENNKMEHEEIEPDRIQSSVYDAEIARIEEEEAKSDTEIKYHSYSQEEEIVNRNDEVISLYKKGRSVLEISKMLSMGQGEVKFVIDLYNAR